MHRLATFKIALAILSIAFLLFNPAGICAGNSVAARSPSHPCCPEPAAPAHHDSTTSSCVCIDRQPVPPSLPALADAGIVVESTDTTVLDMAVTASRVFRAPEFAVSPPEDRFVQYHQLLL